MKKLCLTIVTCLIFCFVSEAQIKRQFQDEKFAGTTVVIKEDNVSDTDILNANFDMDMVSMGTVIKITTAPDRPTVDLPAGLQTNGFSLNANRKSEVNIDIPEVKSEESAAIANELVNESSQAEKIIPENVEQERRVITRRSGGGNYPNYSGYQGGNRIKKFKKVKRKRRSAKKCFRF